MVSVLGGEGVDLVKVGDCDGFSIALVPKGKDMEHVVTLGDGGRLDVAELVIKAATVVEVSSNKGGLEGGEDHELFLLRDEGNAVAEGGVSVHEGAPFLVELGASKVELDRIGGGDGRGDDLMEVGFPGALQ
jgi:hypothetical protein